VECSDCDLAVLEKLIAKQTGFAVEGHHLEFFGVCPDCS
jgi:Fur family ferric uptake transcriptional regulator/Fur family peroxide stress response transcriptional regulator